MAANIPNFIKDLSSLQASGPLYQMIQRLSDGIHEGGVLTNYLNSYGKKAWDQGGEYINWNIVHNNRRATEYYGAQSLDTSTNEFVKQCTIIRAFLTMNVTYFKTDLRINSGNRAKFIEYVGKQIDIAREGFAETIDLNLLGTSTTRADGTAHADNHAIYGLQSIIQDTPGTTTPTSYGGQTRTSSTSWLNAQSLNVASLAALTTSDLKRMMQRCTHMGKSPNLIVCSDPAYRKIFNLAKGENWYRQSDRATNLGYPDNIFFSGADILPLKAMTGSTEGGLLSSDLDNIFFLNIGEGLCWYVDPSDDMNLEAPIQPSNQHILVQHITFNGQLVAENPRLNGQIYW